MIELCQVCAGYGRQQVLYDVDMSFAAGKITVLTGPNGCGKSTLLKSIMGLNRHTAGRLLVAGTPIEEYTAAELARHVAYLPQMKKTPDITVLRMVLHGRFPYLKYPRRYRQQDIEVAQTALRQVGLEEMAEQNMSQLSGGNQQKVYIAMALAQDTEAILMDEPTTYLDIAHQLRLAQLARELADRGKAVVLVLHDLALAMRIADELAVLDGGRIAARGTPEEIFSSDVWERVFGIRLERVLTENGWQYFYG